MSSLRVRLATFLLMAALFVATLIGLITYWQTLRQNEALFDYQLRQTALSLRDQGVVEDWQPETYGDEHLDMVIQIWTDNGATLYLSHPGTALPERRDLGFSNVVAGGQRWRVFSVSARNRIVQVAQPFDLRRDLAAGAALRSLQPLLAFAPVMALLIWWLLTRELQPLKQLTREVTQRSAASLSPVSVDGLPDEITPVAHALNAMLEKLQKAFAHQRAFVGDAAHELRSPLTALKLQLRALDVAQKDNDRRAAMAALNDGVDRAVRLIEQLLTAARTDAAEMNVSFERHDIAEVLRRVIADAFPIAQDRRIGIELDAPDAVIVYGNEDLLRILLRNLVDNALRYTPVGGEVCVKIDTGNGAPLISIDDSGPGIPSALRKKVFRRFYRGPSAGQTGTGLGLSIVRNIAIQHAIDLRLTDSHLGGLRVELLFPAPSNQTRGA